MVYRGSQTITLDQLLALNDEMAALVRAGIPLEQGLTELGQEMPGKLGALASFIGARLSAGETLSQVLAHNEERFPRLWRAVVLAGLRSGQLSSALESLSVTGRRIAELRRGMGLALIYPLLVVLLGYASFVFVATILAPTTFLFVERLTKSPDPWLAWLVWLGQSAMMWSPWLPVVLLGVCAMWWQRSRSVPQPMVSTRSSWFTRWRPLTAAMRDGRMANFAEVLALLLRHEVPLSESLILAADASGDTELCREAVSFSKQLDRGERPAPGDEHLRSFPPYLVWLISVGGDPASLSQSLIGMAQMYRQRADRTAQWATFYVPILITAIVGGGVVLLQALVVFRPICKLLFDLGKPL